MLMVVMIVMLMIGIPAPLMIWHINIPNTTNTSNDMAPQQYLFDINVDRR